MKPVLLYRKDSGVPWKEEISVAERYLPCTYSRTSAVIPGNMVIGRYSVLPFYRELEVDLEGMGAELINSYEEHVFIADMQNWVPVIEEFTPKTWYRPEDVPDIEGSFVLKGSTNSKKFLWDTHMFAETRKDVIDVYCRLLDDSLISSQDIYVRQHVPLWTFDISLHGLPITEEYRLFCYKNLVICGGFYWSNFVDELKGEDLNWQKIPRSFLKKVLDRLSIHTTFYTIDVARTAEDKWIVIEINDGQMAGLSENKPSQLYPWLAYWVERDLK